MASSPSFAIDYRIINNKKPDSERNRRVDVHATQSELDEIVERGFLLKPGLFAEPILDRMRDAIDRLEAVERDHPQGEHVDGAGFYLRYLRDKDPVFRDLLFFEPTLSIARALLGPQVCLEVDGRVAYADVEGIQVPWHIHKRIVPDPIPPFYSYPQGLHCLLYLDDVGEAEGPLAVLPGSHRDYALDVPDRCVDDLPGQELLMPRAGDTLLIHPNLWHRTLPTQPGCARRRLVIYGYDHVWIKTDVTRGVKPVDALTDQLDVSGSPELFELTDRFHW